jgi:hypothetical protein
MVQPPSRVRAKLRAALRAVSVSRLAFAAVALALPPFVACATGATYTSGDGSVSLVDGGDHDFDSGDGATVEDGSIPPDGTVEDSPVTKDGGCGAACCTAAQCPPPPHVATTECASGSCVIEKCSPGWYDFDAGFKTGCTCHASGNPTSCAMATNVPALSLGSTTTLSGNIPTTDGANWFQITFGGASTDFSYHPEITFAKNPSMEFVFDVDSDCTGDSLSCADQPTATGLTTWEEYWGAGDGGAEAGATTPIPAVGKAGVVLLKVYRSNASSGADCDNYSITVSD